MPFSTSSTKNIFAGNEQAVSFSEDQNRPTSEGEEMTTEEMVVDVSQDWVLACDVQQGSMQTHCTVSDSLDYSACCRQIRALGGDCHNFIMQVLANQAASSQTASPIISNAAFTLSTG